MDEPTNHLDIASKNVLKEALIKFQGTLILVSHDRDFLQGLCNEIIEFKDQKIKSYIGEIKEYLEQKKIDSLVELEKNQEVKKKKVKEKEGNDYQLQKQTRSLQNKLSKTEKEISSLEKEIKTIDVELDINYDAVIRQPNFFDNYQNKKKRLEQLMENWEKLQLQLEEITST